MKINLEKKSNQFIEYIKKINHDLKNDQLPYKEIDARIVDGIALKGSPLLILIFSSLIASIGLNINSNSVVLGAKLISPIMLMIFGMSYGISTYQFKLTRRALVLFLVQFFIIVITSTLYFLITPLKFPTDELISKTTVTVFDILLALFGGSAAAIATTRNEKYNVLPGVALVTSLLPAVCTIGYGVANRNMTFITGAFYLYIVNVVFLMFAFFIFFKIITIGHLFVPRNSKAQMKQYLFVVSVILVLIPIIYSTGINVFSSYLDSLDKTYYSNFVKNEFVYESSALIGTDINTDTKQIKMLVVGELIEDAEIENLSNKLKDYKLDNYTINVVQGLDDVLLDFARDRYNLNYNIFD